MQGARGAIRADPEQERRSLAEGSHLREHGEEVIEILAFADKASRLALGAPDLDPVTRTGWDAIRLLLPAPTWILRGPAGQSWLLLSKLGVLSRSCKCG